jgi:hypothetical protein
VFALIWASGALTIDVTLCSGVGKWWTSWSVVRRVGAAIFRLFSRKSWRASERLDTKCGESPLLYLGLNSFMSSKPCCKLQRVALFQRIFAFEVVPLLRRSVRVAVRRTSARPGAWWAPRCCQSAGRGPPTCATASSDLRVAQLRIAGDCPNRHTSCVVAWCLFSSSVPASAGAPRSVASDADRQRSSLDRLHRGRRTG